MEIQDVHDANTNFSRVRDRMLDTHILLWWLDDPGALAAPARRLITDPRTALRALREMTVEPSLQPRLHYRLRWKARSCGTAYRLDSPVVGVGTMSKG